MYSMANYFPFTVLFVATVAERRQVVAGAHHNQLLQREDTHDESRCVLLTFDIITSIYAMLKIRTSGSRDKHRLFRSSHIAWSLWLYN